MSCPGLILFLVSGGQPFQFDKPAAFPEQPDRRPRLGAHVVAKPPGMYFSPAHRKLQPQQFDHPQAERLILVRAELDPLDIQLEPVTARVRDDGRSDPDRPAGDLRLGGELVIAVVLPGARRGRVQGTEDRMITRVAIERQDGTGDLVPRADAERPRQQNAPGAPRHGSIRRRGLA